MRPVEILELTMHIAPGNAVFVLVVLIAAKVDKAIHKLVNGTVITERQVRDTVLKPKYSVVQRRQAVDINRLYRAWRDLLQRRHQPRRLADRRT